MGRSYITGKQFIKWWEGMVRPDRVELPTFWFVANPNSKQRERRAFDAPKPSTYPLVSPADSAAHCRLVLQLSALLLSVGSHRIQNGEVSFEMNIETQFERFMREKEYLLDRSAKTLTYLRTGAKHFLPIIAPAKNEGELRSLAQDAFHHVLELGVSGRSKNTYLGPLRTFLVRSYASGLGQTPRQRRQGGRMVREPGLPVRVRRPASPPENPRKQHFFLQGHDSKLKALALKIVRGEASADQIPDFTRDLRSCIKFLKKMPELRKAFE